MARVCVTLEMCDDLLHLYFNVYFIYHYFYRVTPSLFLVTQKKQHLYSFRNLKLIEEKKKVFLTSGI